MDTEVKRALDLRLAKGEITLTEKNCKPRLIFLQINKHNFKVVCI